MTRVISASAGTGKTTRLTRILSEALAPGSPVRPEGVMAITYTRKAAGELQSRLRQELLTRGDPAGAARIRDGWIGTVHAICHRLLVEHALEGGLSPALLPLPETEQARLFRSALAHVPHDPELDRIAHRLGLDDWPGVLARIVDVARENGLDATGLRESAGRSVEGLLGLLPEPIGDEAARTRALRETLAALTPALEADVGASRSATARAELAASLLAPLERGELPPWHRLVKARKELDLRKIADVADPFLREIDRHPSHPRFVADLTACIERLFGLAAEVLALHDAAKRAARVVDYGDMLALTARLLDVPAVRDALAERLDLLLVDEFQDTSPMQLAIIARLAELAGETAWVGDRKQAIFGFQGSDPDLMDAAVLHALGDEPPEVLATCWRSRPALVALCSEVFALALARFGFPEEQVRVEAGHADPPQLADEAVIECWDVQGDGTRGENGRKRTVREWDGIADGVEALLWERPLVRERREPGRLRGLTAGDVAVLVRTNSHASQVAEALRARGIAARVGLTGLLGTAEGLLARHALAVAADPRDSLAAASLAWIAGAAADDPDAWLTRQLTEDDALGEDPRVARLRALSESLVELSPAEAFDRALEAADAHRLCMGWPDARRRLANLEVLRGETRAYEELCRARRSAATVPGLVAHLDAAGDLAQASPSDTAAVTIVTYHKAKGLEWPVVVIADLDQPRRPSVFGVTVEPSPDGFDAARPLDGRWIRFWPWPYGLQKKVALADAGALTATGRAVAAREEAERARLLYVGFTRARDRIVLVRKGGTSWLDELTDAEGRPCLTLPWEAEPGTGTATAGAVRLRCLVRHVVGHPPDETREVPREWRWFGEPTGRVEREPLVVRPHALTAASDVRLGEVVRLGPRRALGDGADMAAVGDAMHAFLAADPGPHGEREGMAHAILEAEGVATFLSPATLVAASDALREWVRSTFGEGSWHREWPVRWRLDDGRLLVGEVDLVLETPEGLVVIDHKSFPGSAELRDDRVRGHAGQLAGYRNALQAATGRPVRATFIHLPMRGEVVEVRLGGQRT